MIDNSKTCYLAEHWLTLAHVKPSFRYTFRPNKKDKCPKKINLSFTINFFSYTDLPNRILTMKHTKLP